MKGISESFIMANVFTNVFSPQGTGYIEREELQKRLEELFPGSDRDFKIQVMYLDHDTVE